MTPRHQRAGSETRTLATNPIRRVYTEDTEVVYRTDVDIGQRAQIERTLNSELGSYPAGLSTDR